MCIALLACGAKHAQGTSEDAQTLPARTSLTVRASEDEISPWHRENIMRRPGGHGKQDEAVACQLRFVTLTSHILNKSGVRWTDLTCHAYATPCSPLLFCCHQCSYGHGDISSRDALRTVRSRRAVSGQGGRLSEPLTPTLPFRAVECRPFEDPLRNFPFPRKREQVKRQS